MRGMFKRSAKTLLLFFIALLFASCPFQSEGDTPFLWHHDDLTAKFQLGDISGRPTRVAVFIDVENYNPLNALDYVLEDCGTQFFDFVILGTALMKRAQSGMYVHIPPYLRYILNNRHTYIVPLQRAGIRVLLGLQGGHEDVTIGPLPTDDMGQLAVGLANFIHSNWLDGVEIWDINAAGTAEDNPYPSGTHRLADGTYFIVDDQLEFDPFQAHIDWVAGGGQMANFFLWLRTAFTVAMGEQPSYDDSNFSEHERIVIYREQNFGEWVPKDPPYGTFVETWRQVNFVINPDFSTFVPEGFATREQLQNSQYGPFSVNLNPSSGTVVPPLEDITHGNDIFNFTDFFVSPSVFGERQFGIIFYQGLRPVSAAANDDAFDIPLALQYRWDGRTRITQAEYMSITSQAVFGQRVVVRDGGGDRLLN